ncbi:MAG: cyclase family protein [Candidatus Hydrogenedentota bacterium]|nr:MAG: cyclase family protein [Candidatus Hydrogenedentota bacterium]
MGRRRNRGGAVSKEWIDVTLPIKTGMVHWPDNPGVVIERLPEKDLDRGANCNVSRLTMGVHTGTHIDAPMHFLRGGKGTEAVPIAAIVGRVRVIEITDPKVVTARELERHRPRRGERLLFKTANSKWMARAKRFRRDFVYIANDAGEYLVKRGVRTVGIDYLSVGGYRKNGTAIHRILLSAGLWILEGLNLRDVSQGSYDMLCLPLKLVGSDGAPARVFLRRR